MIHTKLSLRGSECCLRLINGGLVFATGVTAQTFSTRAGSLDEGVDTGVLVEKLLQFQFLLDEHGALYGYAVEDKLVEGKLEDECVGEELVNVVVDFCSCTGSWGLSRTCQRTERCRFRTASKSGMPTRWFLE